MALQKYMCVYWKPKTEIKERKVREDAGYLRDTEVYKREEGKYLVNQHHIISWFWTFNFRAESANSKAHLVQGLAIHTENISQICQSNIATTYATSILLPWTVT